MKNAYIVTGLVIIALAGVMIARSNEGNEIEKTSEIKISEEAVIAEVEKKLATIYKSPLCGCCGSYSKQLEDYGYEVKVIKTDDMASIKNEYGIPREMESCHTTVIGEYFVEGHVPFEAVDKLLDEKPSIDGIALPDMPAGAPGMPGLKEAPYEIYQLIKGNYSNYLTI